MFAPKRNGNSAASDMPAEYAAALVDLLSMRCSMTRLCLVAPADDVAEPEACGG